MADQKQAVLDAVREAAEAYDRDTKERREAFYSAVREAAKTCTQTEVAAACGRTTTRINQIVRGRAHSRRP